MDDRESRPYELIVFGATGFTGRLVAEYLSRRESTRHEGRPLRWAIAGRSADKLECLASELGLDDAVGRLVADVGDDAALASMAGQGKVVVTTVGPYAEHGEPVVRACIESGTDYADITGEPEFVDRILEHHDEAARRRGVRLVSCCGFDSVPPDLGALMMVEALGDERPIRLEGFVSARGKPSGGTWQSAVQAMGRMGAARKKTPRPPVVGAGRTVRSLPARPRYEPAVRGWVAPLPTIDPQIVLRSARALEIYGPEFRYGHYVRVGSLLSLLALGAGVGSVAALSRLGPTRRLLLSLRPSGSGPDEEERARSSFRLTFVGVSGERRLVGEVRGGDPGYDETSKMLAESGLCLARDPLPERFGALTPAMAMGERLTARLRAAGLVFELVDDSAG